MAQDPQPDTKSNVGVPSEEINLKPNPNVRKFNDVRHEVRFLYLIGQRVNSKSIKWIDEAFDDINDCLKERDTNLDEISNTDIDILMKACEKSVKDLRNVVERERETLREIISTVRELQAEIGMPTKKSRAMVEGNEFCI